MYMIYIICTYFLFNLINFYRRFYILNEYCFRTNYNVLFKLKVFTPEPGVILD